MEIPQHSGQMHYQLYSAKNTGLITFVSGLFTLLLIYAFIAGDARNSAFAWVTLTVLIILFLVGVKTMVSGARSIEIANGYITITFPNKQETVAESELTEVKVLRRTKTKNGVKRYRGIVFFSDSVGKRRSFSFDLANPGGEPIVAWFEQKMN